MDREIRDYVAKYRMLDPFEEHLKREGVISYGLSSMGYDIRITDEYKVFTNVKQAVVEGRALAVLLASDAAERTQRQAEAMADDLPVHTLSLSSDDLGQQVGRGALAVVAVLDVPATRHLRRQLRRLRQLG